MRKLYAKWVPKYLNADQKVSCASRLSNIWNFFGGIQMIFYRDCWPWTKPVYITITRRQSNNQWSGGIAAHPAHSSDGAIEGHFEGKTPRKITKAVWFLHDNATAHQALATQKKLAYLGFQCLDHPPYSPYLSLSGYYPFPGLKKQLTGRHFSSHAEVIVAAETWLDGQLSEFCLSGFQVYINFPKRTKSRRKFLSQRRHTASTLQSATSERNLGGRWVLWETCGMQEQAVWTKCWVSFLQQFCYHAVCT